MWWENEAPKGAVIVCRNCKLSLNRQLNASINLYLRMWGFLFDEGLGGNSPPNPEKWVIEEARPIICPLILRNDADVHQGGYLINPDIR